MPGTIAFTFFESVKSASFVVYSQGKLDLMQKTLHVLYEDNHLLAVVKPAGLLVQGDRTGDVSLLDIAKQWLIETYQKPGNAFVGMVHRLDRPVAGVVLFAKTSKAASRLTDQFRERTVKKSYLAVVEGEVAPPAGRLTHYIQRGTTNRRVKIAAAPFGDAQQAELSYKTLDAREGLSLLLVNIHTGRHHQIRAQFSFLRHPIVGDHKYGAKQILPDKSLALFAWRLEVTHPTLNTPVTLEAPLPTSWPWTCFDVGSIEH